MINVSEIKYEAPEQCKTPLQEKVYEVLKQLEIPFSRVDTDEVITMEDCRAVNEKLQMEMVKTLFLSNRQKTEFYLFITKGDKPFKAKDFSRALGISRVSFAPMEMMEPMLGTVIGAATVFSALTDPEGKIKIVFDWEVADEEDYGCSDGTTTGYMKLKTADILEKLLPYTGHEAVVIEV